jgi:hypothetical protein
MTRGPQRPVRSAAPPIRPGRVGVVGETGEVHGAGQLRRESVKRDAVQR